MNWLEICIQFWRQLTGLCAGCPVFPYQNDWNAFLHRKVPGKESAPRSKESAPRSKESAPRSKESALQCKESAPYPTPWNFSRILCQCFIFIVIIAWTKAFLLMVFISRYLWTPVSYHFSKMTKESVHNFHFEWWIGLKFQRILKVSEGPVSRLSIFPEP